MSDLSSEVTGFRAKYSLGKSLVPHVCALPDMTRFGAKRALGMKNSFRIILICYQYRKEIEMVR